MENKPRGISRLRMPTTRIAQPSTSFKAAPLNEMQVNTNLTISQRKVISRRSKSFSDLRPAAQPWSRSLKPLGDEIIKKLQPAKAPINKAPTTSSTTSLRKRPNEQQSQNNVKPKVSKPAKPAPYDFKARYNLLVEKHKILVQSMKDIKEQLGSIAEENESNKVEKAKLETKLQALHLENESVKQKYESSKTTTELLQSEKSTLEEKLANSEKLVGSLSTDLKDINSKYSHQLEIGTALTAKVTKLEAVSSEYYDKIIKLEGLSELYINELKKEEEKSRSLLNMVQDLKGNIRVFCRVRPSLEGEEDRLMVNCGYLDENTIELKKSKDSVSMFSGKPIDFKQEFSFDRVFPPDSTQEHVFEDLSQLVQSAVDGYNICVFAYGQTGSGKTFTMQGNNENLGIIPRSIDLLFEKIVQMKMRGWTFEVLASFLEIYNENIFDLLNPHDKLQHEIRHNEGKGSTVTNLQIKSIDTPECLYDLMYAAQKNRAVASTNYNEHSSRSHAVTKIAINGFQASSNLTHQGSLNLVDLAGSESAKTSSDERLLETKSINKSLSTLGNVMLALHNKESHVPYRNSKLTYLLQSCLGGNSKTLMFVNISPLEDCYNETINSLRFANRVKEIKTHSKRNRTFKQ